MLHLELIWCTPIYFALLRGHRYSSLLVTVILGILWSSIKEIEVPYMFDREHGIHLHAMQGCRATSCGEGEVSKFSRVAAGTWGIFSSYGRDDHLKVGFVQ